MSEGASFAETFTNLFEWEDAHPPFSRAVRGLKAAQALWVPPHTPHTIWTVVEHLRFWHAHELARVRSAVAGAPPHPRPEAGEDWAQPDGAPDDAAWQAACEGAVDVNRALVRLVAGLSAPELGGRIGGQERGTSVRQVLQGLVAHTSYHVGEIIFIRRLQGSWPS